jgi:two-component system chemotaxis response regulator CheY
MDKETKYSSLQALIVDDTAFMRKSASWVLKNMGFGEIFEAVDGLQALNILMQHKIDFIISDWLMPKMDGLELLEKIRSNPKYTRIPFLMLTSEGYEENIMTAVKAGVTGFVVKPFTGQLLQEKVELIFINLR